MYVLVQVKVNQKEEKLSFLQRWSIMNNMSSEEKLINSSFVSTRKQPYVLLRNMQYIVNHGGTHQ